MMRESDDKIVMSEKLKRKNEEREIDGERE